MMIGSLRPGDVVIDTRADPHPDLVREYGAENLRRTLVFTGVRGDGHLSMVGRWWYWNRATGGWVLLSSRRSSIDPKILRRSRYQRAPV